MVIKTQYGDFASFKDLEIFMRLGSKNSVFISSCNWWGIQCILKKGGSSFSYDEIRQVVG